MKVSRRGFVIIVVVAFLAIIMLVASVVVNIGCGESIQTRMRNDLTTAYYLARSGAELKYLDLSSKAGVFMTFPQLFQAIVGNVSVKASDGSDIMLGNYSTAADLIDNDEFAIISRGTETHNNRESIVSVKYFYSLDDRTTVPIGSIGPMELYGRALLGIRSWVRAQGPLESGEDITQNAYVKVSGDVLPNQEIPPISFWVDADGNSKLVNGGPGTADGGYDTNLDGSCITDTNVDGQITIDDIPIDDPQRAAKLAILAADDVYPRAADGTRLGDNVVDGADAIFQYYTHDLDEKYGLTIGPGETNYYFGDQDFGPGSVVSGTPVIFVDGDADILFSDTAWWGAECNHTIVSMQDITITQPTNGSDDILTLVAYGDVNTGGVRAFGGVRGDIIIYAHEDFNAYFGGRTDGTIFAEGQVYVDTVLPIPGLLNRDLNKGSIDWTNPDVLPIGLPPGYAGNVVIFHFNIEEESSAQRPIWQRD